MIIKMVKRIKLKVLNTDMTFHFENINKTKIRSLSNGKNNLK